MFDCSRFRRERPLPAVHRISREGPLDAMFPVLYQGPTLVGPSRPNNIWDLEAAGKSRERLRSSHQG
jgi:hypothetical protein